METAGMKQSLAVRSREPLQMESFRRRDLPFTKALAAKTNEIMPRKSRSQNGSDSRTSFVLKEVEVVGESRIEYDVS